MKITELGRVTENSDPEALAAMSIPGHETVVEIPKALLGFAREQS